MLMEIILQIYFSLWNIKQFQIEKTDIEKPQNRLTSVQTGQREFPYHMTSCSAIKAQEKEKGKAFMVMAIFFPSNHYTCWGTAPQQVAGQWEAVNEFIFWLAREACTVFQSPQSDG